MERLEYTRCELNRRQSALHLVAGRSLGVAFLSGAEQCLAGRLHAMIRVVPRVLWGRKEQPPVTGSLPASHLLRFLQWHAATDFAFLYTLVSNNFIIKLLPHTQFAAFSHVNFMI